MSGLVGTRQDERRERRTVTGARKDPARIYGTGGLRRSRSVRKYTNRLISARVAAAMAPAHQYQPPSVTAATIKPAASTTSVMASPSRHHRETLNSRYERIWAKHHEKAPHEGVASAQLKSPGHIIEHR